MTHRQQTVSPIDGSVIAEVTLADGDALQRLLTRARLAQTVWASTPLAERGVVCSAFVDALLIKKDEIAAEITLQMGRPISQSGGELAGLAERARYMIAEAEAALAPIYPPEKGGYTRFITREPVGVVLTLAPWNYPFLTAVNSVIPALMAGNAVVLKHSAQTPLVAERFAEAFASAGLPQGVFQVVHCSHEQVASLIASPEIDFVAFTGSVDGGRAIEAAAMGRFLGVGLELGGKDPAYVRADADLEHAVENLVDGAFFNSGQSCCGIERIYVAKPIFEGFVREYVQRVRGYRLGDPRELETNLGPMVRASAADWVRAQIAEAVAQGATTHVDAARFAAASSEGTYQAPQVLTGVDHNMRLMTEETFGPVVGIMSVDSDEQAVACMNDSAFGLTASVWTQDVDVALKLGRQVETGTWFMNRCDYLDPALAWTGVKNSGRGCTLSRVGYESLTRPKSFHLALRS